MKSQTLIRHRMNIHSQFGVKSGAMYSQNSIYNNLVQWYERPWGFYVSPELGMDIPKGSWNADCCWSVVNEAVGVRGMVRRSTYR